MDNKYKIVISGKGIYREHVLATNDSNIIKVGTNRGCQVRFKKERFFESFEFELVKTAKGWQLNCSNSVYFTLDGVMKLYNKELEHGDEIIVKYQNYNGELFKLNFFIDFDSVTKNYDRIIDLTDVKKLTIGGSEDNHIFIDDSLYKQGTVTLSCENGEYYLKDNNTKYGVYINTEKIKEKKKLNNYDFFIIVGHYFYLKDHKLYTDKDERMHIKALNYVDEKIINSMEYPKFNRSTRIKYKELDNQIEILPPEQLAKEQKRSILLALIPALAMMGITVVLRGMMGGGGAFVLYSVATMSVGVIMSIVTAISNGKEYRKNKKERREKYLEYLKEKEQAIRKCREKELEVLNKIYKPIEENLDNIKGFKKDLFDRDRRDEDYLNLRLGTGRQAANCKVKVTPLEFKNLEDDLVSMPEQIEEKYKYIDNRPIVAKLPEINALGIVGQYESLYKILKNITFDIVGRQFYKDVKLFYMIREDEKARFSWLRWLRHVENDDLGIRNIICDDESKNLLFEYLYIELGKRREDKKKEFKENFIIFVLDNKGIKNHPISKFIESSKEYGVTFVFLEEHEELLPKGCDEIIRLKDNANSAVVLSSINGEDNLQFNFNEVAENLLESLALKIAPVYVDEVTLEGQLTKNISLYELLGVLSVDEIDIEKRWRESVVYKSMAAPLGVKASKEVVYLDLNEKHHGPHGLVAGTTGSGKSEILQSYILSMATLFHPYEVGFVIIDFKGGGMVNQFKDLPHLVGAITNIDGREITRSLLSIKAELRKRQELFAEAEVNHIDAYIKKFKAGEASYPLPHLILIVDEFAELKSDQPEFMKELISAARIGRSLGVHLILATQKPSGVVDEQIWSNSKFKLCLKVQNQQDSKEVLKSPLAAEIKEPGRAYLQVGNNEIFELFQSAYSGASAVNDDMGSFKEFEVNEVSLWGKRNTVFKQEKKKSGENSESQLEAIVEYVNEYCAEKNIKRLPGICLPPLPELIYLSDIEDIEKNDITTEVPIGMFDDPTRQLQAPVILNLLEGNMIIIGSSQFGKTSILQTIIRGVAEKYSPEEVNFYIIDFASMILKNFETLKHVGGVITSSEDEKLKTFTKMIIQEIARRKEILSSLGISSFASYREAGYKDLPHIIIALDNFIAFKELYPDRDEELLNIVREGTAVGVTVIFANSQTNGISYKYMTNFGRRIALYCNDSSEYGVLFDKCRMQPKNVPGRAIISIDKNIYEYQNYLAFYGEKEIDRVQDMKNFIEEINKKYSGKGARIIPEIPKLLTMEYIEDNYSDRSFSKYEIPVGLNYNNIEIETIDLEKVGFFCTVGKEGRGKKTLLRNIMENLQKNIYSSPVEAMVIDNIEKDLSFMEDYGYTSSYSVLYDNFEEVIEDVHDKLEERYDAVSESGKEVLEKMPLLLVVVNNNDALVNIGTNKEAMDMFKKITKQYRNLKVCFIFNNVENSPVSFASTEILKMIKENRKAFLFEDLENSKLFDMNMNVVRNFKKKITVGDCYILEEGEVVKIKAVKNE
ncbi:MULTISPECIES: type VII secretion protein EssC [Clostridium]|uniref:Type VII secretion protein EssC n=1 Tax=Clostridium cibarium TaxID=2762247 RepID=A0ABR8PVY1_9CLOT|nr:MULTISPECIES: type VII secretion protein EssC [Clostridium]MBD7912319.1 type VII secretion protein EssC [Clostridium cibarium]